MTRGLSRCAQTVWLLYIALTNIIRKEFAESVWLSIFDQIKNCVWVAYWLAGAQTMAIACAPSNNNTSNTKYHKKRVWLSILTRLQTMCELLTDCILEHRQWQLPRPSRSGRSSACVGQRWTCLPSSVWHTVWTDHINNNNLRTMQICNSK